MIKDKQIHEQFMQDTLRLAKMGAGFTSPNPMVGALIVKQVKGRYKIIGKGYHRAYGQAHAEIEALKNCTEDPRGASLYVNLEPCCHTGQTGPCAEAIIQAGISEVFIGMKDPNPLVSGKGVLKLEKANIKVHTGVLEKTCQAFNEIFSKWISKKKPFILIKTACTLDGKIAFAKGRQTILGNEKSWQEVHYLRQLYDSILVGVDTLLIDNPKLTCRTKQKNPKHPIRIILDSNLRCPVDAQIFAEPGQNIIACLENADQSKKSALQRLKNTQVLGCAAAGGHIDLVDLVQKLADMRITSILIEGGGTVNSAFLEAGLVDKVNIIYCPQISGDLDAPSIFNGKLSKELTFKNIHTWPLAEDLWWEGYL